ncbi:MAG: serine/threonine protein kinase [Myxococcales bacterium]|nr:serine/threonine protein kinase [Myxococcales bacterium]
MVTTSATALGATIGGTYKLEALLGQGGMGAVYRASHIRLPNKYVAIKFLHATAVNAETLARFRREAEIASRIGHPNIVRVDDVNEMPDGTPYLVLEYLQGETLAHLLARGPLDVATTTIILKQVGSALRAAHQHNIVHRDLKPDNIFLVAPEADDATGQVLCKVLDFGISKIRGSQTVKTQDAAVLGTPQYMSPEQANGEHDLVDERTDVFALGAIAYEMLAGRPAFEGRSIPEVMYKVVFVEPTSLSELVPSCAGRIELAIAGALTKDRNQRTPSVAAFLEAFAGAAVLTASGSPAASLGPVDSMAMTMAAGATVPPVRREVAVSTLAAEPSTVRTRASRRGPLLFALGVFFAAGVGGFLLLSKKGEPGSTALVLPAQPSVDASSAPAPDAAIAVAVDGAPVVDATLPLVLDASTPQPRPAAPPVAGPPKVTQPGPPPSPNATPQASPEPGDSTSSGGSALALAKAGDLPAAVKAANRELMGSGDMSGAHAVLAMDACVKSDLESFHRHLRQIKKLRQKRSAIAFCTRHGIEP